MAVLRRRGHEDPDEAYAQAGVRHHQQHRLVNPPVVDPACPLCVEDARIEELVRAWREL